MGLPSLEELDGPLVLLRRGQGVERAQIPPLARLRILLPRVEPIPAVSQLSNHRYSKHPPQGSPIRGYQISGGRGPGSCNLLLGGGLSRMQVEFIDLLQARLGDSLVVLERQRVVCALEIEPGPRSMISKVCHHLESEGVWVPGGLH